MTTATKYSCLFLLIVLLYSCYDKDAFNVDNGIIYTPEYSVPIGSERFNMDELVSSQGFDTIPADSAHWYDSLLFYYNDGIYYLPDSAVFDTTFLTDFSFNSIQEWLDKATYLMVRLNIENSIPGDALCQVEFLDASQSSLFSLFNEPGLEIVAEIDNPPAKMREDVYLTDEEIDMLQDVVQIRTYFRVSIDDISSGIAYSPGQDVFIQMGLRVGLELDMNE